MASVSPDIVVGTRLTRGQRIGLLGKTGASGNSSHLHLGRGNNCLVNLYPWVVTAYQAEHPEAVLAVARPHRAVRTGEEVFLDGSNWLAFGGRITEWRWAFHDGQMIREANAKKTFDTPGAYVATLRIKDDRGAADVDFCQTKVFSKPAAETAMPHISMTYTPTKDIRPDQPLRFRFWLQGSGAEPIRVDFDDGTRVPDYQSDAELTHSFRTPGVHIVTSQCQAAGKPTTQKLKIIVQAALAARK
jgi:PKD repeat protein